VQVNCGLLTYVQFLDWAARYSQLSKEFIHAECFTFLSSPGYTPSYSFGGLEYESLQRRAVENGSSIFKFNSKVNVMGLLPWTRCLKKMKQFGDA